MKAVHMVDDHYVVLVPEARCTLVLTKEQFVEGLKRAKAWSRRSRQAEREAKAAPVAEDARYRASSGSPR